MRLRTKTFYHNGILVVKQKKIKIPLIFFSICSIILSVRTNYWVWRSLVARLNGVQEVGGSNPFTQTSENRLSVRISGFVFLYKYFHHTNLFKSNRPRLKISSTWSDGKGLLKRYPWMISQFLLTSIRSCSSVSTPSAVTSKFILWAS